MSFLVYLPVGNVPLFSGCFIRFSLLGFQQFDDDNVPWGDFLGGFLDLGLEMSTNQRPFWPLLLKYFFFLPHTLFESQVTRKLD